ncbi:hypothetical protein ACFOEE_17010 [Pseudoalteromonas fenneropenaei]|uniref:Uncharacterized protein n=1 Tax=Pseudoalteromonas fenneropenaei TaxID=1737459 RepID=A0ABV7CNF9_9GAMM
MKRAASAAEQQTTIWHNEAERLAFAELANVFYAREIKQLVLQPDAERMRRLLGSLPYYVERAARHIVQGDIPIPLDTQNACWLSPIKKPPLVDTDAATGFYQQYAQIGLVVPVLRWDEVYCQLFIDSLDQLGDNSLHCNQFGWFARDGQSQSQSGLVLLKPTKAVMTAACCGHQWRLGKANTPRLLSLREMLLASSINWRDVKRRKTAQSQR